MVRDPQLYRMTSSYWLIETADRVDFCDHCKNPVYDRGTYGNNKELRQRAKRGWVVLTDRMYRATGAAGERAVCAPCFTQGGFQVTTEQEP